MSILKRFAKNSRGAAAIEFALLAPVMISTYFGLVEICEAQLSEHKANHVASAVGDLVTQADTVSVSDLTDIFSIGGSIMAPYTTSTLQMRVTSITENGSNQPIVDWSHGSGLAAIAAGSTLSTPLTLASGDSVVKSEVVYRYNSPLQYLLPNALTYSEVYYSRPRRSQQVSCTDC